MKAPAHKGKEITVLSLDHALSRLNLLPDWERSVRTNMQPDLASSADLVARLGHPERAFRSVHVTGTKGKGTVCALIEAGIAAAGWRVGRYASPHLEFINERVSVDLRPVTDEALAASLWEALDARDKGRHDESPAGRATWFDVVTAAAFLCYARAQLDWVVVEVGLGGRLDSTNVVRPEVAVITNIGLEHTDVLGATLEKIAAEKAGIIKVGVPLVTTLPPDSPAGRVVRDVARTKSAPVRFVRTARGATISEQNRATARRVLDVLGERGVMSRPFATTISAADLSDEVTRSVRLPGRMERFYVREGSARRIAVVLDGAHVGFALAEVLRELVFDPELRQPPTVLLAVGADKDAEAIASALVGNVSRVVCTGTGGVRPGKAPHLLAAVIERHGIKAEVSDDPIAGFARCRKLSADQWILVTGSLYLAGTIRHHLTVS